VGSSIPRMPVANPGTWRRSPGVEPSGTVRQSNLIAKIGWVVQSFLNRKIAAIGHSDRRQPTTNRLFQLCPIALRWPTRVARLNPTSGRVRFRAGQPRRRDRCPATAKDVTSSHTDQPFCSPFRIKRAALAVRVKRCLAPTRSVSCRGGASRAFMSRQEAQPLIWEALICTSSNNQGSRPQRKK
jgi:hypothetical protein